MRDNGVIQAERLLPYGQRALVKRQRALIGAWAL